MLRGLLALGPGSIAAWPSTGWAWWASGAAAAADFYGGPVCLGIGLGLLLYLPLASLLKPRWAAGSDPDEIHLAGLPHRLQQLWGTVQETAGGAGPLVLHLDDGKVLQIDERYRDRFDAPGHRLCAAGYSRQHWLPPTFVAIFNPDTQTYRTQWRNLVWCLLPVHPHVAIPVCLLAGAFTYGIGLLPGAAWMVWQYRRARADAEQIARQVHLRVVPPTNISETSADITEPQVRT